MASTASALYTPTDGGTPVPMANENDSIHTTHIAYGMSTTINNAVEETRVTNSYGGITRYAFDAQGNLLQTTLPTPTGASQAPSLIATYDANYLLTSLYDGMAHPTFNYETNGLLSSARAGYDLSTYTHSGADLLTSQDAVQAALNKQDSILYGDVNQPHILTSVTNSLGNQWSIAHNIFGQTTQVTPPSGSPTGSSSVTYDEQANSSTRGYPKTATDGNGDSVTFDSYDALGDLLQYSTYPIHGNTAVKNTTIMAYDAAQRPTTLTHPDGKTAQNVYVGRFLDHTIDEAGTRLDYNYCSVCDALLGVSGPMGWGLSWAYDADHQLSGFTDARGHSTQYNYGTAGELTSVGLPDNTTYSLLYNNVGLVRQITNGRGSQTAIAYDNNERPQQVTFPTSNQPSFTYAYNNDDTVHSVTDGVGTTTVNYLANGAVQSVLYNYATGGLSAVQELDYLYYPDGSLQKLTWKNGGSTVGVWNYSYDAGGRLTGISNGWNENTGWTYDGEGKLTGQTNANGTSLAVGYNQARGWPTSLTYSNSGGVFSGYSLTYDSGNNTVGLLTGVTESGGSAVSYGYDALYRLVSDSRTGTNAFAHSYGYDLAGNVQTLNGSPFAGYDAANKFSSLTNGTFSYDGDGDLTAVSGTGLPTSTFTWEDRGLLTSATAGGQTVSYGYNAGGQRIWSQVGSNPKTFYVFAGSTLLGEIQNGVPSVAYTWGANGLVSERLLASNRSLWYAFGPQGETRQLTDSTGAVADTYLYSPYGVMLASTGSDANPFRYGGQAGYYTGANNLTGTILCGLRWYSPALGRWLSRDPIGYEGGANLYEYCSSNPVGNLDPNGLQATTLGGMAALQYKRHLQLSLPSAVETAWITSAIGLIQIVDPQTAKELTETLQAGRIHIQPDRNDELGHAILSESRIYINRSMVNIKLPRKGRRTYQDCGHDLDYLAGLLVHENWHANHQGAGWAMTHPNVKEEEAYKAARKFLQKLSHLIDNPDRNDGLNQIRQWVGEMSDKKL